MRLPDVDGISPQVIDDLQVLLEHVGVLVIFGGDVLFYGGGEGEAVSLAKGQEEDIAGGGERVGLVLGYGRGDGEV